MLQAFKYIITNLNKVIGVKLKQKQKQQKQKQEKGKKENHKFSWNFPKTNVVLKFCHIYSLENKIEKQ